MMVSSPALAEGRAPVASRHTDVLREFEEVYRKAAERLDIGFSVEIDERSLAESGAADRNGDEVRVTVTRRLLQNSRLSADGLRSILCHEIGHTLGGAPRRNAPMEWDGPLAADGLSFMSSEGQADYYTSLVCFRKLVRGQKHSAILAVDKSRDPAMVRRCDLAHREGSEDSLICQRAISGALSMLQVVAEFPISVTSASAAVAPSTVIDLYPERQCRLDTFIAGALCKTQSVPKSVVLDFNNSAANTCADTWAARPKCWYVN